MTWVGCFQKTVTVLMLTMPTRRLLTDLLLMVDMMDMLDMVLTPLLLIELPEVMLRSYPIPEGPIPRIPRDPGIH